MKISKAAVAAVAAAVLSVGTVTVVTTATSSSAAPAVQQASDQVAGDVLDFSVAMPGAAIDAYSGSGKIKALQHLINAWGGNLLVDGGYGPATTAAVKAFQARFGLVQDGKAGPITLGRLAVTRGLGARDKVVSAIQTLLVSRGYNLVVDGSFGTGTLSVVKQFQSANGLVADGSVGPLTWTKLLGGGSTGGGGGGGGDCSAVTKGADISQTVFVGNNIRVHKCYESRTRAMIADAARAGVTLYANSSWRSPASQIALRRQNCGTSPYAIYQMPSNQCSPHTAIPGTSRHERGLAVDFSNSLAGGKVFAWLSANASKYHYCNYRPENWHWSWDCS